MLQINKYIKDDFTVLLQRNERKYPLEVEIPVVLCLVELLRLLKIDVNKFIFMNSELFSHKWEKRRESNYCNYQLFISSLLYHNGRTLALPQRYRMIVNK